MDIRSRSYKLNLNIILYRLLHFTILYWLLSYISLYYTYTYTPDEAKSSLSSITKIAAPVFASQINMMGSQIVFSKSNYYTVTVFNSISNE